MTLFECPSCGHVMLFTYSYVRQWSYRQVLCTLCGSRSESNSLYTNKAVNVLSLAGW